MGAMRTSRRGGPGDHAGEMMGQVFIVGWSPWSSIQRRQADDRIRRGPYNRQRGGEITSLRATLEEKHHGNSGDYSPGQRRLCAASFEFLFKMSDGILVFSEGHLNQVMNKSWQHRFYQLPMIAGDSWGRFTVRPGRGELHFELQLAAHVFGRQAPAEGEAHGLNSETLHDNSELCTMAVTA